MELDVDVAVIGSGPAGLSAAIEASRAGAAVALAEAGKVGGRALHETTIPTRALSARAHAEPRGDFAEALAEGRRLSERFEERLRLRLEDAGVELLSGRGRFSGPETLRVGQATEVHFERAVIAAGARAATLPGDPLDGAQLLSPDALFGLDALPESMVVVGGGAAAAEIVDALSRLDVSLTWLMDELGILPDFDRELAEAVGDVLMERGVKLVHGKAALEVHASEAGARVTVEGGRDYSAHAALLAVGNRPALDGLDLDAAGLAPNARGALKVDGMGRTEVEHLFAAGDCTGRSFCVAGAEAMGRVAGRAAAGVETPPYEPGQVPRVAFTHPELAQVGATPERVVGREVVFHTLRLEETFDGLLRGVGERAEAKGVLRVVCDSDDGRVLGATAIGPGAAEMASAVALALRLGATDAQLGDLFAAVPGALDAVGRATR